MYNAYVIFEDSPSVWTRPFKRHFRHVSVVLPLGGGQYVHIDPRMKRIEHKLITHEDVEAMYDRTLYHDVAILKTVVNKGIDKDHKPMFFTCVEFVKRAIGLHAFWVFTPSQLYDHILKSKRKEACLAILKQPHSQS